jgi:ubiquitin fusion degradation protein 1
LPPGGLLHHQGTMAAAINYDAIAPSSAAALPSNFLGEGQKLNKKGSKAPTPKPSTPVAGTSTNTTAAPKRTTNGAMPLRLPPNKLFFGYEIKPVKTQEQKDQEKENAGRPHFAGQGQSLRGAIKRKGEIEDKTKPSEKKGPGEGRRLDGRKPK